MAHRWLVRHCYAKKKLLMAHRWVVRHCYPKKVTYDASLDGAPLLSKKSYLWRTARWCAIAIPPPTKIPNPRSPISHLSQPSTRPPPPPQTFPPLAPAALHPNHRRRRRRATPPAATILARFLLEQASPQASPSTKPRVCPLHTPLKQQTLGPPLQRADLHPQHLFPGHTCLL